MADQSEEVQVLKLVPAVSPGVIQRAPGHVAEVTLMPTPGGGDGVWLNVCGRDGAVAIAPLTRKEARKLAANLRSAARGDYATALKGCEPKGGSGT